MVGWLRFGVALQWSKSGRKLSAPSTCTVTPSNSYPTTPPTRCHVAPPGTSTVSPSSAAESALLKASRFVQLLASSFGTAPKAAMLRMLEASATEVAEKRPATTRCRVKAILQGIPLPGRTRWRVLARLSPQQDQQQQLLSQKIIVQNLRNFIFTLFPLWFSEDPDRSSS